MEKGKLLNTGSLSVIGYFDSENIYDFHNHLKGCHYSGKVFKGISPVNTLESKNPIAYVKGNKIYNLNNDIIGSFDNTYIYSGFGIDSYPIAQYEGKGEFAALASVILLADKLKNKKVEKERDFYPIQNNSVPNGLFDDFNEMWMAETFFCQWIFLGKIKGRKLIKSDLFILGYIIECIMLSKLFLKLFVKSDMFFFVWLFVLSSIITVISMINSIRLEIFGDEQFFYKLKKYLIGIISVILRFIGTFGELYGIASLIRLFQEF